MGDSSDDEVPVPPIVFSAEAKAILGDDASVIEKSSPSRKDINSKTGYVDPTPKRTEGYSPQFRPEARSRVASPSSQLNGALRIVRLSPATLSAGRLQRAATTSSTRGSPVPLDPRELITPAARPRSVQNNGLHGMHGSMGSARLETDIPRTARPIFTDSHLPDESQRALKETEGAQDIATHIENLSITRTKPDDTGVQGSLRIKRLGKVTGRYLSGPARRGMKRRQSEEGPSPMHDDAIRSGAAPSYTAAQHEEPVLDEAMVKPTTTASPIDFLADDPPMLKQEEQQVHHAAAASNASLLDGSPIREKGIRPLLERRMKPPVRLSPALTPALIPEKPQEKPVHPVFKVPPLPPLPSRFDQENDPPPTFKRNKPNGLALSEKPRGFSVMSDRKMLAQTPDTLSPKRQALAPRSQNTPMRPAPPPPKMTVLETATAPAGSASASQARKKRNYISVNGKLFTRMDCIGRGGSSKVYRVMAENYKVFALKRVTLEDQDEAAIRGYKGEIDLLKRLENVERVVRLFDWELNEERQTLSVLMEMGESDLNRVLTQRLNTEEATFDVTFTRYFWKEMLECVQAVHQYDIVHSDLKPANFLLLQGKLKLIDFGISNAIQDNTVNVHREQHIGTPNYMSPEALVDSNAASGLPANVGKLMKLGKPSDVWSLGCILYQMVYGKPPFAHIANQMQRIMAIPNPHHIIDFPSTGVGNVPLSSGLIKTLRRCLNRDPAQRPTVDELLGPNDSFLDPDSPMLGTVPVGQELIARLQHNIIKHIKEKGMPTDAELAGWPARFFVSIKAAVEEGRA